MIRGPRTIVALVLLLAAALPTQAVGPATLKAADGTTLAVTHYPGKGNSPGVLLLSPCDKDRTSWDVLARHLAGRGFHVLTLDYRGYGQSGGTPHAEWTAAERQRMASAVWPSDIDAAAEYLRTREGVSKVAAVGGASCGVDQAVQLAQRRAGIEALVLLSGSTTRKGRAHLKAARLPLFTAGAEDDGGAADRMAWLDALSGNAANANVRYPAGGHGTGMFATHAELRERIGDWLEAVLLGNPTTAREAKREEPSARVRTLMAIDEPGGPARIAKALAEARASDPKSDLLAATFLNQLGDEVMAVGDARSAVDILRLNTELRPTSANAWDSLAEAWLAAGMKTEAREASRKALQLVDQDKSESTERRRLIRESAEQRLRRIGS